MELINISFGDNEPILIRPIKDTPVVNYVQYTVKEGDRLDTIAYNKLGNSLQWEKIAQLNSITNPFDLTIGQTLLIPFLP